VITDRLRVRTRPEVSDASQLLTPLLGESDAVYVVDGPVDGSGYRWYEVYAPRAGLAGWVAWADKDGEPWIGRGAIDCTLAASDDAVVNEIGYDLMHLACYKDETFSSKRRLARVNDDGLRCPDDGPYWHEPGWLDIAAPCVYEYGSVSADTGLADVPGSVEVFHPTVAAVAERLLQEARDPIAGISVLVVGRIDHPDARNCRAVGDNPPSPVRAVLECRSIFVITAIQLGN